MEISIFDELYDGMNEEHGNTHKGTDGMKRWMFWLYDSVMILLVICYTIESGLLPERYHHSQTSSLCEIQTSYVGIIPRLSMNLHSRYGYCTFTPLSLSHAYFSFHLLFHLCPLNATNRTATTVENVTLSPTAQKIHCPCWRSRTSAVFIPK